MRTIGFFAALADLKGVLDEFESGRRITYTRAGHYLEQDSIATFGSYRELPDLGVTSAEQTVAATAYLVVDGVAVNPRQLLLRDGGRRLAIDQLLNPHSLVLNPGGLGASHTVIAGEIGSASDSPLANQLMKDLSAKVREHFVKIRSFWVGKTAEALLASGARLTSALQSPREMDLSGP